MLLPLLLLIMHSYSWFHSRGAHNKLTACRYIKCIVTTSYVLILDANLQAVKEYISRLQQRLQEGCKRKDQELAATVVSLDQPSTGGPPFELKALEAALDEVCHTSVQARTRGCKLSCSRQFQRHAMPLTEVLA